ncbi:MAG: hypothetical protein ACI9V8_001318 [Urechidicola sp.]|jgi:hypothetical protein
MTPVRTVNRKSSYHLQTGPTSPNETKFLFQTSRRRYSVEKENKHVVKITNKIATTPVTMLKLKQKQSLKIISYIKIKDIGSIKAS